MKPPCLLLVRPLSEEEEKREYAVDCAPYINKIKPLQAHSYVIYPQRVTAEFVWVVFKGPLLSMCIINIIIMLHARLDL